MMTPSTQDLQWKRLGGGNLLLKCGQRAFSVAIGLIIVLLLSNLDKLPVDINRIISDKHLDQYLPQVHHIFFWIVVLYFVVEALILVWDLLAHFAIRYRLAPDMVVKRGGVYRTYTHTIPGSRVQGVEVTATPFQRLVRVSTVTITTAGVHSPNMTIENLATAEAVAIQNQLGVDHG